VDEVAFSGRALRRISSRPGLHRGRKKTPRKDWDGLAGLQKAQLKALLKHPTVQELMSSAAAHADEALDSLRRERFASLYAIRALNTATGTGSKKGLKNDARLVAARWPHPVGPGWIRLFIAKDPRQSSVPDDAGALTPWAAHPSSLQRFMLVGPIKIGGLRYFWDGSTLRIALCQSHVKNQSCPHDD